MSTELWRLDAVELARMVKLRAVSAREVVQATLDRLDAVNPKLNAVVLKLGDEALAAADDADRAVARGDALGPLHGVPVTTKINTDQKGCPTDNGVIAYKDLIAPEDGAVAANFRKAGAIIIGRTNAPSWSMRWFTDNLLHGRTLNPFSAGHTPGGSSGGAASAVAAGIGPIAHGNDIAGSIRYPAYCCGIVGLRPTYGRIPAYNPTATGMRPISSAFMAVQGPLTRHARDLRPALAALSVGHVRDNRWVDVPLEGPPVQRPIRVAMSIDPGGSGVHPAVADAVRKAGAALSAAGYAVEEVAPPRYRDCAELWPQLAMDDVIAGLAPLIEASGDADAIKAMQLWYEVWTTGDFKRFREALALRDTLLTQWQVFLAERPLILTPVSNEPPFAWGDDTRDGSTTGRMIAAQSPQTAIAVLGLPAVSVPTGLHQGLPLGVQITAGRYREDLCIDAAEIIETALGVPTPIDPRP